MNFVATTDHGEIKEWMEKHQGTPSIIDQPNAAQDKIGIRVDFPGTADEAFLAEGKYRKATWDEFFSVFDERRLRFVYDNEFSGEDFSNAYRFERQPT